jgi:hypothetical protein
MHRALILFSLISALPFTAVGQMEIVLENKDHSWVIKYGAHGNFGLEQTTYTSFPHNDEKELRETETTVFFGSRTWKLRATVWPILAIVVIVISPLIWLAIYGIGSFARRPRKHPPPVSPPV